jgi:hypothetical protein
MALYLNHPTPRGTKVAINAIAFLLGRGLMMIRKNLGQLVAQPVIMVVLAALCCGVTVSASDVGRTAADFLYIGQGARAAGLGGAYTAVSEGAIAAYWNPAGLAQMDAGEVSLGHFSWYQDITVEQACLAFPLSEDGAVMAASLTYVNYGNIEGYDQDGAFTENLSAYDLVGGLSIGYPLSDALSLGVTGKIINEKLDTYSATGFAADLGLKYDFGKVAVAAALTNVGSGITFDKVTEDLPTAVRLGVAVSPFNSGFMTSVEVEKRLHGDFVVRQGMELGFSHRYYLRAGYDYLPSQDGRALATTMSVGGGLNLDFAKLDYAFTPNDKSTSEDLHRFTLVFSLGH